jgi:hypothetical protein
VYRDLGNRNCDAADRLPAQGNTTHFGPRMRGKGDGAASIASLVLHYTTDEDGDDKDKG